MMIECPICGATIELNGKSQRDFRCKDQSTCFKNRKTLRIYCKKDINLRKYNEGDIFETICRMTKDYYEIMTADFIVFVHHNGGVEFVKDRYENSKGKIYFAE